MKYKVKLFNEKKDLESLLSSVKIHLIHDIFDDLEIKDMGLNLAWKRYINNQTIGECQEIVSNIVRNFPQFIKHFGEIEIDNSYMDEYGDEQNLMTHHWVTLNGTIYEFSKGTLNNYIDYNENDLYDIEVSDTWRYN